jgi:hypothetical protein
LKNFIAFPFSWWPLSRAGAGAAMFFFNPHCALPPACHWFDVQNRFRKVPLVRSGGFDSLFIRV